MEYMYALTLMWLYELWNNKIQHYLTIVISYNPIKKNIDMFFIRGIDHSADY